MKDPYHIILKRYITEKATMLEGLKNSNSNRSLARFKSPKYVFLVAGEANKKEIAEALEAIYQERQIAVTSVNTIWVKGKKKRRGRAREGMTAAFKKAIVTLEPGDTLEKAT